jgi:pimeloyl-ACP methyl ester carboxylesterase
METVDVRGTLVDVLVAGTGAPLLFLHAEQLFDQTHDHLEALARHWRVIAPRHPGFGPRSIPDGFRSVDDLAYLYLDLLDTLGLEDALVVGASLGGWIGLEMCVRNTGRVGKLALIGAVGVKLSPREERDFADLFYLPDQDVWRALFADPSHWAPRYSELPAQAVETIARERQATAHYAWRPYLHNPALKRWLHRIDVPTLLLWGEADRFAAPAYGRKLAEQIPGATFELIPNAGHLPHIEQSNRVVKALEAFAAHA